MSGAGWPRHASLFMSCCLGGLILALFARQDPVSRQNPFHPKAPAPQHHASPDDLANFAIQLPPPPPGIASPATIKTPKIMPSSKTDVATPPLETTIPKQPEVQADHNISAQIERDGRSLLRLLEHGDGPVIEIAWPATVQERNRLYGLLKRCYGMRLAIMDDKGRLFSLENSEAGQPWDLNLDRFSLFIRHISGNPAPVEAREARQIKSVHGLLPTGKIVRVFPRRLDARLLGGLRRIVGNRYQSSGTLRARYRLSGNRVFLSDVNVDGERREGDIEIGSGGGPAGRPCGSQGE